MELNKQELDRYITNQPDNGYDAWVENVVDNIDLEDVSQEEFDEHFDKIIEPALLQLSTAGTLPCGGVDPKFAADVIKSTLRLRKLYFPDINTWEELRAKISLL